MNGNVKEVQSRITFEFKNKEYTYETKFFLDQNSTIKNMKEIKFSTMFFLAGLGEIDLKQYKTAVQREELIENITIMKVKEF